MWSKKKAPNTEESLNQELLNNLHSFVVKYRSIGNRNTANQLVDIYTQLNKEFSNSAKDAPKTSELPDSKN